MSFAPLGDKTQIYRERIFCDEEVCVKGIFSMYVFLPLRKRCLSPSLAIWVKSLQEFFFCLVWHINANNCSNCMFWYQKGSSNVLGAEKKWLFLQRVWIRKQTNKKLSCFLFTYLCFNILHKAAIFLGKRHLKYLQVV